MLLGHAAWVTVMQPALCAVGLEESQAAFGAGSVDQAGAVCLCPTCGVQMLGPVVTHPVTCWSAESGSLVQAVFYHAVAPVASASVSMPNVVTCSTCIPCNSCLLHLSAYPSRRATTTVHDQASLPDTLNTPRSSIDPIQQEVLLELLDSFHVR